jgi:hypothetical protein
MNECMKHLPNSNCRRFLFSHKAIEEEERKKRSKSIMIVFFFFLSRITKQYNKNDRRGDN